MLKFLVVLAPFAVVVPAGSLPVHENASLPIIKGRERLIVEPRIFGGKRTVIEEVPYQVSLIVLAASATFACGGSIISEYWVLTAAHCVQRDATYTIRAGTSHRAKGGTVHRVVDIISHDEYYNWNDGIHSPINDIALIRVAEPFKFDRTRQPVTLYEQDEEISEGTPATISGYGRGSEPKHVLNYLVLEILSKNKCNLQTNARKICAGNHKTGKDACKGDSGGPLVVNGRLAGITSFGRSMLRGGYECGVNGEPSVYTEVASYRDWIKEHSGV